LVSGEVRRRPWMSDEELRHRVRTVFDEEEFLSKVVADGDGQAAMDTLMEAPDGTFRTPLGISDLTLQPAAPMFLDKYAQTMKKQGHWPINAVVWQGDVGKKQQEDGGPVQLIDFPLPILSKIWNACLKWFGETADAASFVAALRHDGSEYAHSATLWRAPIVGSLPREEEGADNEGSEELEKDSDDADHDADQEL